MALNIKVGDIITVSPAFVAELKTRAPNTARKALLEFLGILSSQQLLLTRIAGEVTIKVAMLTGTNRRTYLLAFEREQDINSCFSVAECCLELNSTFAQVKNGTTKMIRVGDWVVQSSFEGSNPQVPVVVVPTHDQVEKVAIFGMAAEEMNSGEIGRVLVEGVFTGVNTNGASIETVCYTVCEGETPLSIPGAHYRQRAVAIDIDPLGTIYLNRQPGGPYQHFEYRSICGIINNKENPIMGQRGQPFARLGKAHYANSAGTMFSAVSARKVSNTLFTGSATLNAKNATSFAWAWAQFVANDLIRTETSEESADILVPPDDAVFTPRSYLPFKRTTYAGTPRYQVNGSTSFLDGSVVYGDTPSRSSFLRLNDGSGKLKTSDGDLLPKNTSIFANLPSNCDPAYFLAGDLRANQHLLLISLHTIFVREHNRKAEEIKLHNPLLTEEQIYQSARRYVVALIQSITYNEFLPILLGEGALSPYCGYEKETNPTISIEFAALFRVVLSMVPSTVLRLNENLESIARGPTQLSRSYFRPDRLAESEGIDPILRGASQQICNSIGLNSANDIRNVYTQLGQPATDLIAVMIQRARDHGIPPYNVLRATYNLPATRSYSALTSDSQVKARLASVYTGLHEVDGIVGALAEAPVSDALVGELIWTSWKKQFEATRDGDRFWYEAVFYGDLLQEIKSTKLADVIKRNSNIGSEMQANVFIKSV